VTTDDDAEADRHLQDVYDELVTALYVTKQLAWSAPPELRPRVQDLVTHLIEQIGAVDEAEERLGGRAETMTAPSAHERRNLLGEVGNDVDVALDLYVTRLGDLADRIAARSSAVGGEASALLTAIATGLRTRAGALLDPDG